MRKQRNVLIIALLLVSQTTLAQRSRRSRTTTASSSSTTAPAAAAPAPTSPAPTTAATATATPEATTTTPAATTTTTPEPAAQPAQDVPDATPNTPFVVQAHAGFLAFFSSYGTLFNLGGSVEFKVHEAQRFSVGLGGTIDGSFATSRFIAALDVYRFMVRLRVRIPIWSNHAVSLSVLPVAQLGFGVVVLSSLPGANGSDAAFVADLGAEVRARFDHSFFAWVRPIGFAFTYFSRASSLEAAYLAQVGAGWYL